MINGKKILAVIPARAGSKGLPGKNIKMMCGKPLIAWTIEQARNCALIDDIVVSTDSVTIAAVGKEFGASIPFMRPAELATDTTPSVDVMLHALGDAAARGHSYEYAILLEPTSPLRKDDDIANALTILEMTEGAESIVGVCRAEAHHPAFLVTLANGYLRPFARDFENGIIPALRRQDIADVYFFEGSLYISTTSSLERRKSFYHTKTLPYIVEKWQSFEVDDEYDFCIIEALMKFLHGDARHENM